MPLCRLALSAGAQGVGRRVVVVRGSGERARLSQKSHGRCPAEGEVLALLKLLTTDKAAPDTLSGASSDSSETDVTET